MNKLLENYDELVPKRYQIVREVVEHLIKTYPTYCDDMRIDFGSGALSNWIFVRYKNNLISRIRGTRKFSNQDRVDIHNDMFELVGE